MFSTIQIVTEDVYGKDNERVLQPVGNLRLLASSVLTLCTFRIAQTWLLHAMGKFGFHPNVS